MAKFAPGVGHTFFYTDHLGSTRLVGSSSESADDMRRDYYPYGEALTAASNDDTPYTFTQKELDSATGLHYFGARYYDPRIGRWLSLDPLISNSISTELDVSLLRESPYIYVSANPITYIDPDGRYKLHTKTVMRYPMLMSAVLKTEEFALQSKRIQRIFSEEVGTPVSEFVGFGIIMEATGAKEFIKGIGKGPEIIVTDLGENQAGRSRTSLGHTEIEVAKWLVERLQSNDPNIVAAATELLKRTILHETVHRLNKNDYNVHGETGNRFEQEAFDEPPQPRDVSGSYWDYWFNVIWPQLNPQND